MVSILRSNSTLISSSFTPAISARTTTFLSVSYTSMIYQPFHFTLYFDSPFWGGFVCKPNAIFHLAHSWFWYIYLDHCCLLSIFNSLGLKGFSMVFTITYHAFCCQFNSRLFSCRIFFSRQMKVFLYVACLCITGSLCACARALWRSWDDVL